MPFKKHYTPWNKGLKTGLIPKSAFKKGDIPKNKTQIIKFICKFCNKDFTKTQAYLKWNTPVYFCSRKCYKQGIKYIRDCGGSKNPSWKGGTSPVWILKESIRIHGYNCQKCNSDKRIDTHHIDKNPKNNPPDGSNWQRLCRKCHWEIHDFAEKCRKQFSKNNKSS